MPWPDGGRRVVADKSRGIRHICYPELMERRAKGLCFRCGDKFHPLHQCSEKQLRLLMLDDNETLNGV